MRKFITESKEVFDMEAEEPKVKPEDVEDLVGLYVRIPLSMKRLLRDETAATCKSMSALVRYALTRCYESTDDKNIQTD